LGRGDRRILGRGAFVGSGAGVHPRWDAPGWEYGSQATPAERKFLGIGPQRGLEESPREPTPPSVAVWELNQRCGVQILRNLATRARSVWFSRDSRLRATVSDGRRDTVSCVRPAHEGSRGAARRHSGGAAALVQSPAGKDTAQVERPRRRSEGCRPALGAWLRRANRRATIANSGGAIAGRSRHHRLRAVRTHPVDHGVLRRAGRSTPPEPL